jgi:hypothetical protein
MAFLSGEAREILISIFSELNNFIPVKMSGFFINPGLYSVLLGTMHISPVFN